MRSESVGTTREAERSPRRRLGLQGELALALLPTLVVLAQLALVEALSSQRLLFASLASSAFLIYHDPHHAMNTVRTLVLAHAVAVSAGLLAYWAFGHGYAAGAGAMAATIFLMILLDAVHPPAVSTALVFALQAGAEDEVVLFALALGATVVLVALQRAAVRLLARFEGAPPRHDHGAR